MNTSAARNLTLAHAAIKHALYFLEINADTQAASYCSYAAEHLQNFAIGLTDVDSEQRDEDVVLRAMHALAHH
ncbi:MAG: hypothetical protein AAF327_02575 [Cyanobacteria bacterium P01_A01_bin.37]